MFAPAHEAQKNVTETRSTCARVGRMSRRKVWEEVYRRFDPERPAVERDYRVDRPQSPAQTIIQALDQPFGDARVLFTGTTGTGKSTELVRVTEARRDRELVVFLDLERHFSEVHRDEAALERISPWEVCFLAGLALVSQVRQQSGFSLPEIHLQEFAQAWTEAARGSHTPKAAEIDVGTLTKALVGLAAGGAGLAAGPAASVAMGSMGKLIADAFGALKLSLPVGRTQRDLPDQEPEVQTMLGCVNVLIGVTQSMVRRVLFVIDGLDRIRDIGRAKALFVDSHMISQLACPSIVCGPFALRHHPSTTAIRGFNHLTVLVNEPVLSHSNPALPGPGVEFFREVFARRVNDFAGPALVPEPLLVELAYRSGGRARDFVRFIRVLAEKAWQADVDVATEALVRKVLDDMRRQREMGLHKGHIRLLEEVMADPEHRFPEGPLAQELFTYGTLLPYPNESEWFYPHPLLTMHLVKAPGSTPSASN